MKLTFNSADIISWKNYYQNYVLVKRHDYRIGVYLDFTGVDWSKVFNFRTKRLGVSH